MDWVEIHSLKPHPQNPNKHSKEQIERLAKMIKAQGWRHPIIVSKETGLVVAGHGRLSAAKLLKEPKVPIEIQSFQSPELEYAFLVGDNAIASWAELDLASINEHVVDLGPDFDIELLGIKDFELEPADKYGDKDADAVPEIKATKIRLGDLFQLESHRLLCGDSTDFKQVDTLMNGEKADMVFTDPPYGIDLLNGGSKKNQGNDSGNWVKIRTSYNPIVGDEKEYDPSFCLGLAKDVFLFGGNYFAHLLPRSTHWLVWNKHANEEPVKSDFSDAELIWTNLGRKSVRTYRHGWSGLFRSGNRKDELQRRVHPTQKPVGLIEAIFKHYEASLVIDPFLGSGSILIACEKTNRKCYGMEIDPQYCQVIIDRWEKFTGKKAEKINGGTTEKTILRKGHPTGKDISAVSLS